MNSEKYIGRSSSNHRGRGDGFHREFNHGIHPRDGSGDDSSVLYYTRNRAQWLAKLREAGVRRRAERLYEQLDMLRHLRQQARRELLAESRKHAITAKLRQIPYLGPIRSALAVALIQTPQRFRSKRQLWAYSGL